MDEPDFIVDYDAKAPSPLDPHIANVWLGATSNRFVDGYDLEVSASFGEQMIPLEGDDFSLSVSLGIKKASIEVQFKNCQLDPIFERSGDTYAREDIDRRQRGWGISTEVEAGASSSAPIPDAKGVAKAGKSYGSESFTTETRRRTRRWKQMGPQTVEVEDAGRVLEGQLVDREKGWFVKPDPTMDFSAVVATLTTRGEWIQFGRVDDIKPSGGIGKRAARFLKGKKTRDKDLFGLLLRTLAARGLQNALSRDATLAVSLHVLRKPTTLDELREERPMVVPAGPPLRSIGVDSSVIDTFLQTDSQGRVAVLREVGVSSEELQRVLSENGGQSPRSERLFIAGTAPPSALASLEFTMSSDEAVPTGDWDAANQNRSRTDLVALGLIEVRDGRVYSLVPDSASAEDTLRHAAMKAPTLQVTREILLEDPHRAGVEIGEEIGTRFSRNYNTEASKLRVGNALRRWAVWLEPHLVDPTNAKGAARLRISAKSERPGIGAPSFATPENVRKAQAALDQGVRAEDVAKMIGVSRATIYGWSKQGIVSIPKIR
ncbi:hypothetical protein [Qingshengfaniella alkalisoli]|uniref:Helix-turn-helix domain-containing protein n=1 Tax=Qingshengfaniella alkalisoli TaxID=2599296 RepID=A0A5B8I935_9RHOB|nr:hypothetical protein [Qingshengfaniella alkalisoli]QDY69396.1 hypothetical protein FPZ52_07005 [Qingshengfaniella alkalisoli]